MKQHATGQRMRNGMRILHYPARETPIKHEPQFTHDQSEDRITAALRLVGLSAGIAVTDALGAMQHKERVMQAQEQMEQENTLVLRLSSPEQRDALIHLLVYGMNDVVTLLGQEVDGSYPIQVKEDYALKVRHRMLLHKRSMHLITDAERVELDMLIQRESELESL